MYNFDTFNQSLEDISVGSLCSSQSLHLPLKKERPPPFQSLVNKSLLGETIKNVPHKSVSPVRRSHLSLSQQISKFEDRKHKHAQSLERKTSHMKQMFRKGKGK